MGLKSEQDLTGALEVRAIVLRKNSGHSGTFFLIALALNESRSPSPHGDQDRTSF